MKEMLQTNIRSLRGFGLGRGMLPVVAAACLMALPARADVLPNGDKLVVKWTDVTVGTNATNLATSTNVTGVDTEAGNQKYTDGLRFGAFANVTDGNTDTYAVAYMFDIDLGETTTQGRAEKVVLKLTPINYNGQYATDRKDDFEHGWIPTEKNWWPTTFIVQGSNDKSTFTEIARFDCLGLQDGTDRTYTDTTSFLTSAIDISSYRYIRIINDKSKEEVLMPWGGWSTQLGLSELAVYDASACTVSEKMVLTKQGSKTSTLFTKLLDKSMARSYESMSVVPNTDGTPSVSTNAPQLLDNPDNEKLSASEKEYKATDDLPNMLDGDNSTFFHSTWYVGTVGSDQYNAAPTEYHYIQIDLGNDGARNNFAIYMNPRPKDPNLMPMHISVYASNTEPTADAGWQTKKDASGNAVWTKLIELEDTRGEQYFSGLLWTKESYRYLRLVNEESYPENQYVKAMYDNNWVHELNYNGAEDSHAQPYFCLSEFQLCSADNVELKSATGSDGNTYYYEVTDGSTEATFTQMLPANTSVTSITVPDEVTLDNTSYKVSAVSNVAFTDCSSLSSVTLGNNVSSIGTGTFIGTSALEKIVVGEDNTQYSSQDGTFLETYSVLYNGKTLLVYPESKPETSFTLPSDIVAIDQLAFYEAHKLETITLPEDGSLKTIASCAFQKAEALKAVTIPRSVETIGRGAFEDCSSLEAAYIHGGSIGDACFRGDSKLKILNFYYDDGICEGTAPDKVKWKACRSNVTSIGEKAFYGVLASTSSDDDKDENGKIDENKFTTVLDIPRSVTSIGASAFQGCTQIETLKDHSQMQYVASSCYGGMTNLKEAYLYCPLIENAGGWTHNGIDSWTIYDCTNLTDLYLYTPNFIKGTLNNCGSADKHTLHVFADLVEKYKNTDGLVSSFVSADNVVALTADLTVGHASGGTKNYSKASPYSSGVYEWPMALPDGMKAYYVKDNNTDKDEEGNVYLTLEELQLSDGILPANTPVILEAEEGKEGASNTVNLYSTATATAPTDNKLQGCAYDYYEVEKDGAVWGMTYDNDGLAEFRKVKAGTVVPKGKVYIDINVSSDAKLIIRGMSDATGITELPTAAETTEQGEPVIYDLQGRRVTSPKRGIYIVNGKKIYVR